MERRTTDSVKGSQRAYFDLLDKYTQQHVVNRACSFISKSADLAAMRLVAKTWRKGVNLTLHSLNFGDQGVHGHSVAAAFPNVTDITFYGELSDDLRCFSRLQKLTVFGENGADECDGVDTDFLVGLQNLHTLRCPGFEDYRPVPMPLKTNLRTLVLEASPYADYVEAVEVDEMQQLEALEIREVVALRDEGYDLDDMVLALPQSLTRLQLGLGPDICSIREDSLTTLGRLTNLQSLFLVDIDYSNLTLPAMTQLSGLTSLSLIGVHGPVSPFSSSSSKPLFPALRSLSLCHSGPGLTEEMAGICYTSQLGSLSLRLMWRPCDLQMRSEDFRANLTSLVLKWTCTERSCEKAFGILLDLTALRELSLRKFTEGAAHEGLKDIFRHHRRKVLKGEAVGIFSPLRQLIRLSLANNAWVISEVLAELHYLPNLRELDLSYCTGLTDDASRHLRGFSDLVWLSLEGSDWLTDVGMGTLEAMTTLETLKFDEHKAFTAPALKNLCKSLRLLHLCLGEYTLANLGINASEAWLHGDLGLCKLFLGKRLECPRNWDLEGSFHDSWTYVNMGLYM